MPRKKITRRVKGKKSPTRQDRARFGLQNNPRTRVWLARVGMQIREANEERLFTKRADLLKGLQAFELLLSGCSYEEIGERMGVSRKVVGHHLTSFRRFVREKRLHEEI